MKKSPLGDLGVRWLFRPDPIIHYQIVIANLIGMKSGFYKIVIVIVVFALVIDAITLRILFKVDISGTFQYISVAIYISVTAAFYFETIKLFRLKGEFRENILRNRHYPASGMFVLLYLPKLVVIAFHLLGALICFLYKLIKRIVQTESLEIEGIYPLTTIGFIIAGGLFFFILFGIIRGKFLYRVKHVHLSSEHFPKKFNEFRLVQISDLHIGSFRNHKEKVDRAMQIVNDQEPDLICFTGDLINMFADEAEMFVPSLSKLEATYGKYAILGNHDYGEYYPWDSEEEWLENIESLKNVFRKANFRLLLNEHEHIEREGQKFTLAGVENWGKPPFPQYGDLAGTLKKVDSDQFIILLSHDPSHWDAQVKDYPSVFLTLSGHTHAMQFGIGIGRWQWSPVKWKYKKWAGLYSENGQHLYVNKGLGFIGFPGRVGMYPEITVFHLTSAADT